MSDEIDVVLARIDERTQRLARDVEEIKGNYVTKVELRPIKSIVFGGVGFTLLALLASLITLVFTPSDLPDGVMHLETNRYTLMCFLSVAVYGLVAFVVERKAFRKLIAAVLFALSVAAAVSFR